jgi:hypothetical protein
MNCILDIATFKKIEMDYTFKVMRFSFLKILLFQFFKRSVSLLIIISHVEKIYKLNLKNVNIGLILLFLLFTIEFPNLFRIYIYYYFFIFKFTSLFRFI